MIRPYSKGIILFFIAILHFRVRLTANLKALERSRLESCKPGCSMLESYCTCLLDKYLAWKAFGSSASSSEYILFHGRLGWKIHFLVQYIENICKKNLIKIQVADSCTVSTALTNFLIYSKVLVVADSNLYIWKHFLIYNVKT